MENLRCTRGGLEVGDRSIELGRVPGLACPARTSMLRTQSDSAEIDPAAVAKPQLFCGGGGGDDDDWGF